MTFTKWLRGQVGRDDPVGDLAGDAEQDSGWPAKGQTLTFYHRYLEAHGACPDALRALALAWEEYLGARRASVP